MSNTAVFLDRDGTLIHDPGYLNHPDQVKLAEGAVEALKELRLLGYRTVVASNQSGVARGVVSLELLERIHDRLRELLAAKGTSLDGIYYCPYHPDGIIPEYRRESDDRKPKPGMLLTAARELDLDLTQSWMIGDSDRDVEAGRSAGCRTILIGSASSGAGRLPQSQPDHVAVNIKEAINIIKKHHRSVQDARITLPSVPETADEKTLAAPSVEILSMAPEPTAPAVEEKAPAAPPEPPALQPTPMPVAASSSRTDQILTSILEQMRRMQKNDLFGEFSLIRMLAGLVQVFVPFCLLLALWFLMSSNRQDNNILIALGFAAVLQLMALTFYIMHGRR